MRTRVVFRSTICAGAHFLRKKRLYVFEYTQERLPKMNYARRGSWRGGSGGPPGCPIPAPFFPGAHSCESRGVRKEIKIPHFLENRRHELLMQREVSGRHLQHFREICAPHKTLQNSICVTAVTQILETKRHLFGGGKRKPAKHARNRKKRKVCRGGRKPNTGRLLRPE